MTELMTWVLWVSNPLLVLLAPLLLGWAGGFVAGRWGRK